MNKFLNKKGQAASFDVLVATIIFIMLFVTLRGIALDNIRETTNDLSNLEAKILLDQSFSVLTKTNGYPDNWNTSNVNIIGLAKRNGEISEAKLTNFVSMDYNTAKTIIGLSGYEFLFSFVTSDENISFGKTTNNDSFSKRTIMSYNGGKADVTLTIYR